MKIKIGKFEAALLSTIIILSAVLAITQSTYNIPYDVIRVLGTIEIHYVDPDYTFQDFPVNIGWADCESIGDRIYCVGAEAVGFEWYSTGNVDDGCVYKRTEDGLIKEYTICKKLLMFDGTWHNYGDLNHPFALTSCVYWASKNKIYCFGGAKVSNYDFRTYPDMIEINVLHPVGQRPQISYKTMPKSMHRLACGFKDKIYCMGGVYQRWDDYYEVITYPKVWVFDGSTFREYFDLRDKYGDWINSRFGRKPLVAWTMKGKYIYYITMVPNEYYSYRFNVEAKELEGLDMVKAAYDTVLPNGKCTVFYNYIACPEVARTTLGMVVPEKIGWSITLIDPDNKLVKRYFINPTLVRPGEKIEQLGSPKVLKWKKFLCLLGNNKMYCVDENKFF